MPRTKCSPSGHRMLFVLMLVNVLFVPIAGADSDSTQRLTIELTSYQFDPATIEATAGRTVHLILVNRSWINHNFTLNYPRAGLDVDVTLSPYTSVPVEFTLKTPGSYLFYCDERLIFLESHRDRGMVGQLVVKAL